ncbi:hypothetical protein K443DRAFT_420645 [Laccaria amethystina LaAM-08-1]|uniref:Uncharacterized protein n=1 Tax=Laccaria amethystina LaAM-08-1 TaxID=1095629 RepID=A0A0C9WPF1_9AGAR|nr:hypothetical protein K443DRAFT_420645 [Laccaria amethystina LaAM-08-1]
MSNDRSLCTKKSDESPDGPQACPDKILEISWKYMNQMCGQKPPKFRWPDPVRTKKLVEH